ncbi:MAG: hypothetical protein Q9217_003120 [Psora testacea]
MDNLADTLQAIGYHAALARPLLPTYSLLIFSAIIPIYTGSHASLKRPSSAAKPPKRRKSWDSEDEDDEAEAIPTMEGLSPLDAIFLPLVAGSSLAGLYLLIRWLEDPALLSKLLNWYFSLFGVVALAKLGANTMDLLHDLAFPKIYHLRGQTWEARPRDRKVVSVSGSHKERTSPWPGFLSILPLPRFFNQAVWNFRDLATRKLHVRAHLRSIMHANFKIGLYGIVSALLAVAIQLYANLIYTSWYINNLSAFAFVYSTLQILSPTTSWTATLILGALFAYDIYFVFYTPLMVEVATKLDIPAKMLFPRPEGMSMLGLGDLVVPGIVVGFALRFDLWLFYFRKQKPKAQSAQNGHIIKSSSKSDPDGEPKAVDASKGTDVVKPQYYPATGLWGTRFWTASSQMLGTASTRGAIFPKPYFYATMAGYIIGLLCTLLTMQIFGRAQPALLYLVPGVLGALWGTAALRREVGILWRYSEEGEKGGQVRREESCENDDQDAEEKSAQTSWWKYLLGEAPAQKNGDKEKGNVNNSPNCDKGSATSPDKRLETEASNSSKLQQRQTDHIIYFSVSYISSSTSLERETIHKADGPETRDQATMTDTTPDVSAERYETELRNNDRGNECT